MKKRTYVTLFLIQLKLNGKNNIALINVTVFLSNYVHQHMHSHLEIIIMMIIIYILKSALHKNADGAG
jgi:ABC-type uncharacterized transport system permease subunit